MADLTFALAGNPNAGKTTIFNTLTGLRQHTGNWPGKTVEKKEGEVFHRNQTIKLVDLPGAYSLTAYSPEEIIARDFIIEERPDVVINVVDVSNLERNLYLTVQILELDVPVVLALNMMDGLQKEGGRVDTEMLSRLLGDVPVVRTTANKSEGIPELIEKAVQTAKRTRKSPPSLMESKVSRLSNGGGGVIA